MQNQLLANQLQALNYFMSFDFEQSDNLSILLSHEWLSGFEKLQSSLTAEHKVIITAFLNKELSLASLEQTLDSTSLKRNSRIFAMALLEILDSSDYIHDNLCSLQHNITQATAQNSQVNGDMSQAHLYVYDPVLAVQGYKVEKVDWIPQEFSVAAQELLISYDKKFDNINLLDSFAQNLENLAEIYLVVRIAWQRNINDRKFYQTIFNYLKTKDTVIETWTFLTKLFVEQDRFIDGPSNGKMAILRWLKNNAKSIPITDKNFYKFTELVLSQDEGKSQFNCPVTSAINSEHGFMTQALFRWWFQESRGKGSGLSPKLKSILERSLEDGNKNPSFITCLSFYIADIWVCDRNWTKKHWLPILQNNGDTVEFKGSATMNAWSGLLYSNRLTIDLAKVMVPAFIKLNENLSQFSFNNPEFIAYHDQYAVMFTKIFLDVEDAFDAEGILKVRRQIIKYDLLETCNNILLERLAHNHYKDQYWSFAERYLEQIIPKAKISGNERSMELLARICIEKPEHFDASYERVKHHFEYATIANFDRILHEKDDELSEIAKISPKELVCFIFNVTDQGYQRYSNNTVLTGVLKSCLEIEPSLQNSKKYRTLIENY